MKSSSYAISIAAVAVVVMSLPATADDGAILRQAKAMFGKGEYQQSLTVLQPLMNSADPSVHLLMGQCFKKLGYTDESRRQLEWCQQSDDRKVRKTAERELTSLGDAPATNRGPVPNANPVVTPPREFVDDSARDTVRVAAKLGWKPCTAPGCLNFGTKGWHHERVAGHPPTDQWVMHKYSMGYGSGRSGFNQKHIGHTIEVYPNRPAQDKGICPVCNGLGWVRRQ